MPKSILPALLGENVSIIFHYTLYQTGKCDTIKQILGNSRNTKDFAPGFFINSIVPFEQYKDISRTRFFVDKSELIKELLQAVTLDGQQYFCITRPRRFGKTVMANMIGAFFEKAADASFIFDQLRISQYKDYQKHLNQYEVIYIDFNRMPENCTSYDAYIHRISCGLKEDLIRKYPELDLDILKPVWDTLQMVFEKTKDRFVFVMDEWDAVFHKDFIREYDRKKYLEFLRDLLKGQAYVEFAYMTGVLPIAKYSSGS